MSSQYTQIDSILWLLFDLRLRDDEILALFKFEQKENRNPASSLQFKMKKW